MAHYLGILDGEGEVFGVRIPDLLGCYGGGKNREAAVADAISAAREWMQHRLSKGLDIPQPTSLDGIARLELAPGDMVVDIPVLIDAGRSVRANLSLDAALLEDIDRAAKLRGLTRSSFVASAVRDKIEAEA